MKGKKTDTEFLSNFITECIQQGIDSPIDIVAHAKSMISSIDEEIKRVEQRKIIRSKLLDVINTFEKPTKLIKDKDIKTLYFYKIQNPHVCKYICDSINDNSVSLEKMIKCKYNSEDVLFCIKQLIEHKVIDRNGSALMRGEKFDEYIQFIFGNA